MGLAGEQKVQDVFDGAHMLCLHLGHGAGLRLMSKAELFLSHFHRCTVGPEVNGFDLLFSVPTTRPALCLQVTAGEWSHTMGVYGGGGESGRQREEEGGKALIEQRQAMMN